MKYITRFLVVLVVMAAAVAVSGCSRDNSETAGDSAESGASERQSPSYLRTVAVDAPRHARKVVGTATLQHEIKQFHAVHGRYPSSLDEFVQDRGTEVPTPPKGYRYDYDPQTGKLQLVEVR